MATAPKRSTEREAPHDVQLEQALLGAIFINNQAMDLVAGLTPEHFYEPLHANIFYEMQRQIGQGMMVSPLTLRAAFPEGQIVGHLTISQYLARLCGVATTAINAGDFATRIRHFSEMRESIYAADDMLAAPDSVTAPDEAIRIFYDKIDAIRMGTVTGQSRGNTTMMIGDSVNRAIEYLTRRMQGELEPEGLMTGIADLDNMTGGLRRGDLVLAAGRPGMGKTSFGAGLARQVAAAGHGAGLFSFEMPEPQISARILADQAHDYADPIHYNAILQGRLHRDIGTENRRAERLVLAARDMQKMPLRLECGSRLTVGEIAARSRAMSAYLKKNFNTELELLVVDYLKYVKPTERYKGQKVYEVGEISGGLKQLAKEMGIAVVLLCQLSREVEKRQDKRPQLSDLRESGDLEADADMVIFLYREAYYLQNHPDVATDPAIEMRLQSCFHEIELIMAKQRNGPTGTVKAYCDIGASAIRTLGGNNRMEIPGELSQQEMMDFR